MQTFSESTRKLVANVFIAPFAVFPAAVLPLMFLVLSSGSGPESDLSTVIQFGMLFTIIGWVVALFMTVCYGLPIALLLQRFGKFKLAYILPASVMPALALFGLKEPFFFNAVLYSYYSLCVALCYWYLYKNWHITK